MMPSDAAAGSFAKSTPDAQAAVPLCVDLDGTLTAGDTSWEAFLLLAKHRPLDLFRVPGWLSKGRGYLKDQIFQRVMPDAAHFPYRQDLLQMLRAMKNEGVRLVLATGSDRRMAAAVADHLGIFDEYIASDGVTNMTRGHKLAELERRFGPRGFDYIGNSAQDIVLWKGARCSYVVAASPSVLKEARAVCQPTRIFEYPQTGWRAALRAMRPHQWVKNLLIFVPLLLAHQLHDLNRIRAVLYAFWSFSACASAIYLINDLLDIEADRRHSRKRFRPFAAGTLGIPAGFVLSLILLVCALAIGAADSRAFLRDLILYLVVTIAYSFWLKRLLLVDVIILAALYTLRIIAGADAAAVELTMWLLAFSMFLFVSIAFAKRYAELIEIEEAGEVDAKGRAYRVTDLRIIESVGPASGYLAVMVFCNYLDSASSNVGRLYPHPHLLWLVAPIILYWITRIWFIARRGELDQDPIVFAIRDNRSYFCGLLAVLIVLAASWSHALPFLGQ
ncbi:MAG TPA: UbiA family prenyltransferase [Humisphaera sp.]|jgi:4-hydroxybenzoate polyprenyltransferase|nr:UbiA family prenyltransferase [Humisphaera sp.]